MKHKKLTGSSHQPPVVQDGRAPKTSGSLEGHKPAAGSQCYDTEPLTKVKG